MHQLVDDLDGTVLGIGEGETVQFALGGTAYEVDLSVENAAELRSLLDPYISAGRRTGSGGSGRSGAPRKRAGRDPEVTAIRAWANSNGYEISERGRIPAAILDAYRAAH